MNEMKSTVFILAGTSGAGKSTLLKRAHHHNIPIFGEEVNALFQSVNPERGREMRLFESALPTRLFQSRHAPQLLSHPQRPLSFVVHLDLLNLLMFLVADPAFHEIMPPHLRHDEPRHAEDLLDKKKNREIYLSYLKNGFPYADPLIINTLYLSFHRNADQWNQRAELMRRSNSKAEPDSFAFMYDKKKPRQDIHRAIHETWFEVLEEIKCHRAYVSKNAKGILEIKELMPNAGAIREYPFMPINKNQLAEA